MAFETVDSPTCPVHQRKLLIAAGLFTKELAQIAFPAVSKAQVATAENALYVIWLRLLQMARSVQSSCYLGYAHEQQGLIRSMVNAAADLIFLAEQKDADNWAMLYGAFSIERRKRISDGYVRAGILTQKQSDALDAQETVKEQEVLRQAKVNGITPATKHNRSHKRPPQTWSGLSDRDMIKKTGRPWYDAYYVPFSDFAHANIMTAEAELLQIKAGQVSVGPRFPARPLLYVITGMADTMSAAIERINGHFQLGRARDISAHERGIHAALREYRGTLLPHPLVTSD